MSEQTPPDTDPDVVWTSTVDLGVWTATVTRLRPYEGELTLTLNETGDIVHRENVHIAFNAPFGVDPFGVDIDNRNTWEQLVLQAIDFPERRTP